MRSGDSKNILPPTALQLNEQLLIDLRVNAVALLFLDTIMTPRETVEYVAGLAKLKFNENEIEEFAGQFQNILGYIGEIEKLDLEGIEPLTHITQTDNVFRDDVVTPSLTQEEALANAPKRNESFFKVPKVLG